MHEDQGPALCVRVDFTLCSRWQLRVWKLSLAQHGPPVFHPGPTTKWLCAPPVT